MEKAIIIIDMPDNCTKCTFIHRDYCSSIESYFCGVNHKRLSFSHVSCRPIECPLRELPEEDHENHYPDEWEDGYADGWNACLREITGQPKEDY